MSEARCSESEAVDLFGYRLRASMHWCSFDTDFEGHRDCRTTNPQRRFTWEDPADVIVAEDALRQAGLHAAADRLRDAAEHRCLTGYVGTFIPPSALESTEMDGSNYDRWEATRRWP